MTIPQEIKLFNQTYDIIFDDDYCTKTESLGQADINHNQIYLCQNFDGRPVPAEKIFHTLCHELMHVILFVIAEYELYKNEKLTDTLATAIEDLIIRNFNHEG